MDAETKETLEFLTAAASTIEEELDVRIVIKTAEEYAEAQLLRDNLLVQVTSLSGNDFVAVRAHFNRLLERVRSIMRAYEDGPAFVNGRPL